jgi:hypothetical protein
MTDPRIPHLTRVVMPSTGDATYHDENHDFLGIVTAGSVLDLAVMAGISARRGSLFDRNSGLFLIGSLDQLTAEPQPR